MKISEAGVTFVKKWEKFSPILYDDVAGNCTVGYGHLVHFGPTSGKESESPFLLGIDMARADELLLQDLYDKAEFYVNKGLQIPITQNQYDALVSLTYNIGGYAFTHSTLLRKLNELDFEGAAKEFGKWIYAGGKPRKGLANRRAEEEAIFRGIAVIQRGEYEVPVTQQ